MVIARLSERLTFQKSTVVADSYGNHRNAWEDYFTCWCYANTSSGTASETQSAGLTVTNSRIVFTVRYCSELADLDSAHFRVKFRGCTYDISGVDMMNYGRKSVKVTCEWEGRDTGVSDE